MARTILLIICCFLLPPLAVGLVVGITMHFWINLILTILSFGILGIIHALFIVLTKEMPA